MANPTGAEMVAEIEKAKPNPKNKVICLLNSVKREGIIQLMNWLDASDYFTAPASIRFHGCYPGGLTDHCLAVYDKMSYFTGPLGIFKPDTSMGKKPLPINIDNVIIAAICHDLCKVDAYISKDDGGYKRNPQKPKGHAKLSIQRVSEFIKLEQIEEMMIRFHMGPYFSVEMDSKVGEYHLLSQDPEASKEDRYGESLRNAWYHNPAVKFFYIADELATQAEKAKMQ